MSPYRKINLRFALAMALISFVLSGCQSADGGEHVQQRASGSFEEVLPEIREAFGDGELEYAYQLAIKYAEVGDASAQYTVALLLLNSEAGEFRRLGDRVMIESLAVDWLKRSAAGGIHDAAEYLADSYQYGWNSLPINNELSRCWRRSTEFPVNVDYCIDLERSLSQ